MQQAIGCTFRVAQRGPRTPSSPRNLLDQSDAAELFRGYRRLLDKKIAALRAHKSQIKDMDKVEKRFRIPTARLPDGTERWIEKVRRFVLV